MDREGSAIHPQDLQMQLHMFTFDTELDNSIMQQSGGSWINKLAMGLKAFHNEKDGQMYQNSDSPVDEFRVMGRSSKFQFHSFI